MPANHQKLGERNGTDSLSQPSERATPANRLISDFKASRTVRQTSVIEATQFVVPSYSIPSKLIQSLSKEKLYFPSCINKSAAQSVHTSEFCQHTPSPHQNHRREEETTSQGVCVQTHAHSSEETEGALLN